MATHTTFDKAGQRLAASLILRFPPPIKPVNKTDRHDITEIVLKSGAKHHTVTLILHNKNIIYKVGKHSPEYSHL